MGSTGSSVTNGIPERVWPVLEEAWGQPFTVSSDFARKHALGVAMAASLDYITNLSLDGRGFSKRWHITLSGASVLHHRELLECQSTSPSSSSTPS